MLPPIDDSLRLLGRQQWFSTMDLASGYWQVAMSPDASRKAAFVTLRYRRAGSHVTTDRGAGAFKQLRSTTESQEVYVYAD